MNFGNKGPLFASGAPWSTLRRVKENKPKPHIVVLGAGFGGLAFCRSLHRDDVTITLIDRQNHHLFQPLLYQVATAGLSAPDIAKPIRSIFADRPNITVQLDEARDVDLAKRCVQLRELGPTSYDCLVLAIGGRTNYFGNEDWAESARGLKSLDDAMRIRRDLLLAFEQAERESDRAEQDRLMRCVVVGGGPTGVELAGAVAELAKRVLARDFRRADPRRAQVILLEVAPRILTPFSEKLSASACRQLARLGVEVKLNQKIKAIRRGAVELDSGVIEAGTILWGAGVRASGLCDQLDVPRDRIGRIQVQPDLTVPGHPEVFAIGDIVALKDAAGKVVPGVSPAAMQMGQYAARVVNARLEGRSPPVPFTYRDKGSMATIGRSRAVAQIGRLEFSGFLAWLTWLLVHLVFLVGFRNKITVFIQWFYSYVNYRRGARIITGLDRTSGENLAASSRWRAEAGHRE